MDNIIKINNEGEHAYDIIFSDDFKRLRDELLKYNIENKRICIVTDSNVAPLYANEVKSLVDLTCKQCLVVQFKAGELSKKQETINKIYDVLVKKKFDRKDLLIALGGGVVGDITGFVAATYMRGIDYIQVPTTLLAQVDSSIGGKTGIDYKGYKNIIGAFKMPKLVYINLSTLKTLPERDFNAGMGEVIKYGLIMADDFYEYINQNVAKIKSRDLETLSNIVYMCCRLKKIIVEDDPYEKNVRKILNLGHTFGHAIEKCKGFEYLHGECVSLGIVAAAYISYKIKQIDSNTFNSIKNTLASFSLPIAVSGINPSEILKEILNDKKMHSGCITFIVLKRIGKVNFYKVNFNNMPEEEKELLINAIETITIQ
ncbi:MAG: 3-dehydroquinate synthase [Eubacterium sp.]|nr:3-dehydroquinate synthase [Eubacterium sp.]